MIATVIGHGKSAELKAWGQRIDACDLVIRMWNWHWQSEEDYGRKYDVGFFEWHSRAYGVFRLYNQHVPSAGWIISDLRTKPVNYPVPNSVPALAIIKPGQWTYGEGKLVDGMGAEVTWQLTRGTMAACWAMNQANPGDELVLVGFDNVLNSRCLPIDEGFSKTYQASTGIFPFTGYKEGAVRYGYHDFDAEHRLLEAMAEKTGVSVKYAQECWQ